MKAKAAVSLLTLLALSACAPAQYPVGWQPSSSTASGRQYCDGRGYCYDADWAAQEQARAKLEWLELTTAQDQCNAGQQSSCIVLENWYTERRQEKAQEQANATAAALEQQAETAADQRQRDADQRAWWRNYALQNSIDSAATQNAINAQIYNPPTFHGPDQSFLRNLNSP